MKKNVIGILGGTFNPIHKGHVELAVAAHEQFNIPQILVMPSGDPSSYKDDSDIISSYHRCNMVKLAIKNYDFLKLSDIEVRRNGKTYTSDTLAELKNDYDYIYFIMGADSLFAIEKWHEPEYVLNNCHILAACRDEKNLSNIKTRIAYLKDKYDAAIDVLNTKKLPYSSTDIRRLLKEHKDVSDINMMNMISNDVYEYILNNSLYRN